MEQEQGKIQEPAQIKAPVIDKKEIEKAVKDREKAVKQGKIITK